MVVEHFDSNNNSQDEETVLTTASGEIPQIEDRNNSNLSENKVEEDIENLEFLFSETQEGSLTHSIQELDRENLSINAAQQEDCQMLSLFEELDKKYTNSSLQCFPENPLRSENSQYIVFSSSSEEENRIGTVDWCTCSQCVPMPTNIESVCCREIDNAEPYIEDAQCITEHEFFNIFCARQATVDIVLRSTGHVKTQPSSKEINRHRRKTAYRSFTSWVHGWLGAGNRRPIPACVVNKVRSCFPDEDNEYLGLKKHREYPAEFQALSFLIFVIVFINVKLFVVCYV